jgi:hypothetical protein
LAACNPGYQELAGVAMLRFLLRLIGLGLLALAFFFIVYDGSRSIANQRLAYTDVAQAWAIVDQNDLNLVQTWLNQKAAWADPSVQKAFELPICAILAVVAMILMLLGRKKKPLIGYARN